MQVGTKRMVGEVLFPQARRQFGNASGGVLPDPLEHIDEISIRIDAVQSTRDDQTLDDADVLGAEFSPTEKPGFSTHGNDTQRALDMVGVDRYVRIGEKYLKT